jgi:hypothetical protein
MSTTHTTNLDLSTPPVIKQIGRRSLVIGVVASVIAIGLGFTNPQVFFRGYLLSFMDWLGICLGSMAILMIRHMTGGGWGMVIRRVLGASMRTLPLMAALFIPLAWFGVPRLYPWAMPLGAIQNPTIREHLEHHDFVRSYLNWHGFVMRGVVYFLIWGLIVFLLSKWSAEQNKPPIRDNSARFKAVSGPGLIIFAFTISFASIDWVMSLDPSWISTIYGLLFVAGELLAGLAFAVVIERILYNYKPMSILLRPDFVHDHGKFMLTFIMVWAYFSFSQWLIIWAGNLPNEISFYLKRLNGGWQYIGLFLALFHFCVPFAILLSRPLKRNIRKLVWLAVWLMFMRYLDLFWIIEANYSKTFTVTIADIVVPVAIGGVWLAYFCRNLSAMPLLPAYDPSAGEVFEEDPNHPRGIAENT